MKLAIARAFSASLGVLGCASVSCFAVAACAGGKPPPESAAPAGASSAAALTALAPPSSEPPMPSASTPTAPSSCPSFAEDLAFLERHGPVVVLEAEGGGRVAVSARYQARVMTSAVSAAAPSLGYINRDFIQTGQTGTAFDNYGGEDRFWLGPEGGQYALYFAPGKPFSFEHWQTPAAFQQGEWDVAARARDTIVFVRRMKLKNYSGFEFELDVRRTVRLLDDEAVAAKLGASSLSGLEWVAYETVNQITNVGGQPWTKDKGLLSVWILGMYNPSPDTFVLIPFDESAAGEIVNDRYFGKVPAERLRVLREEGVLLFKCDGRHRSKIGLGPARAKAFAGSYSAAARLLTVVQYEKPNGATEYVNSMWEHQEDPYGGDVVNSYNDGPVEPGKPALGGFYEIETSSPAAALAPRASLTHVHRTLHVSGGRAELDAVARSTLGVGLDRTAE